MNTYKESTVLPLSHEVICDICTKSRAHGNHTKCSKARQKAHAERRAPEKAQ